VARFPGHAPSAFLARCSATRFEPSRPGRANGSFPLAASPGSAHGIFFTPFAGLLPPKADAHLCESGPTCPFHRDRATRLIFVGPIVFGPIQRLITVWTSGINLQAIRTPRRPFARANYNRSGADPAMGFASCRVVDTRSCIRAGSTPRGSSTSGRLLPAISTAAASPASVRLGEALSRSIAARGQFSLSLQRWRSQSARGLRRLLPGQSRPGELPPIASIAHSRLAIASSRARPLRSPALQRVEGADALLFRARSSLARRSSLSEVLHRP
jgi:hypothetical protein